MNLVERVVGKILICCLKRTPDEMRRSREAKKYLKSLPSRVEIAYTRQSFVEAVAAYYANR